MSKLAYSKVSQWALKSKKYNFGCVAMGGKILPRENQARMLPPLDSNQRPFDSSSST